MLPPQPQSFELDTNNTLVGFFSIVTNSFGAVAGGIALISLIVGGIVIMNIMLVSVTERTREIGIRKALGARGKDILLQFLVESATMALVGGAIGVLGGVAVAQVVTLVLGFPSTVAFWSVLAGPDHGDWHGNILRSLSGAEGRAAGPDCGAESGLRLFRGSDENRRSKRDGDDGAGYAAHE